MRTITCKELGSVTAITVGNTYEIINESGSRFTIINDKGVQANYGKNLFNEPVVVAEPQVAAPQAPRRGRPPRAAQAAAAGIPVPEAVVPQRPQPRSVDAISVDTSANYGGDETIGFKAIFDFGNNSRYESVRTGIISTQGVSASCGIQSLSGINSLNGYIENTRIGFNRYIQDNAHEIAVDPNINIDELFSEVTKGLVQDLISVYQGDDADVKAGILLVSTTEEDIPEGSSLRTALTEASIGVAPNVQNPNSGNRIITWLLPVEA